MPHATADDGVKLHYEETGSGVPVVFVHEFAGDLRSWEPQLRHFGQRHRAIAYNARGYPPSAIAMPRLTMASILTRLVLTFLRPRTPPGPRTLIS